LGFAVLIGSFVLSGLQPGFSEGLRSAPLVASSTFFSGLVITSVLLVNRKSKEVTDRKLVWLGNSWMLVTIPLVFDFLVDSYYGKPVVIVFFALIGFRYWRGIRNTSLGFVISIFTSALVAGDGLGHLKGGHCVPTGFTGCPVKAVSDLYLLMMLLPLTYVTISSRSKRPSLPILLLTAFLSISVFIGFGLPG